MKAKVKTTGEIVDVYAVEGVISKEQMYKENEWTNMLFPESSLDFEDTIDWEERRYEIAKDTLAALVANVKDPFNFLDQDMSARCAIEFADELIKQLKGE